MSSRPSVRRHNLNWSQVYECEWVSVCVLAKLAAYPGCTPLPAGRGLSCPPASKAISSKNSMSNHIDGFLGGFHIYRCSPCICRYGMVPSSLPFFCTSKYSSRRSSLSPFQTRDGLIFHAPSHASSITLMKTWFLNYSLTSLDFIGCSLLSFSSGEVRFLVQS